MSTTPNLIHNTATTSGGYLDGLPTKLRIFSEDTGENRQWTVDGASDEGYTYDAWSFDTFEEALAALPEIAASLGIIPDRPPALLDNLFPGTTEALAGLTIRTETKEA